MTVALGHFRTYFYVAPKITIPFGMENFSVAGGVLYTNITGNGVGNGAGIVYGGTTFGSNESALTLGPGYDFSGGEFAQDPVFLVGGEARLSNSVALPWLEFSCNFGK